MNKTEFKETLLYTIKFAIVLTICFLVIDVYTPIKQFVLGNKVSLYDFLNSIKLKEHSTIIIAVSFAMGVANNKRVKKN